MPRVHKRKYEKIDEAEINLVMQCTDSHEFYERYREEFPTRKKGIDSISKIWKRRGEFLKKHQGTEQPDPSFTGSTGDLEVLLSAQNKILAELSGLMKEQVRVSKEILTSLQKPIHKSDETDHKTAVARAPEAKETPKRPGHDKPPADIMIGS
jgi:hypothetical protein